MICVCLMHLQWYGICDEATHIKTNKATVLFQVGRFTRVNLSFSLFLSLSLSLNMIYQQHGTSCLEN